MNGAEPRRVGVTADMCRQMGTRAALPIHGRTLVSSPERIAEPIERLRAALTGTEIVLAPQEIGATWVLPEAAGP